MHQGSWHCTAHQYSRETDQIGPNELLSRFSDNKVGQEVHAVVGLKLEGMKRMAYVWAKAGSATAGEEAIWGDVRVAGLRNDIPAAILAIPLQATKPGSEIAVLSKKSQIRGTTREMVIR
jgi:hypothetical protein